MKVRDIYFAAWAILRDIPYNIKNNNIYLDIDRTRFNHLKLEYNKEYKLYFNQIRELVRRLKNEC